MFLQASEKVSRFFLPNARQVCCRLIVDINIRAGKSSLMRLLKKAMWQSSGVLKMERNKWKSYQFLEIEVHLEFVELFDERK